MPQHKMTTEEFKAKVYNKYGDKVEILSPYNGGTSPIGILYNCEKHGKYYATLNAKNIFANSFQPCKECNSEIHSKQNKEISNDKTYYYNKLKLLVESKGGELLSKEWITAKTTYEFKCKNNHVFKTTADCVNSKHQWCPYCYGRKGDFEEEMRDIIESKNGTLLNNYTGSYDHLKVRCNTHNYEWDIMPLNIKKGRWCPICNLPYSEKVVYDYLVNNQYEFKIQYSFDDLKSNKGELLRFDFIVLNNDKLSYLIEIDDNNHRYKHTRGDKKEANDRDIIKNEYCDKNNIKLYRVIYDRYDKNIKDYDFYYDYIHNFFIDNKLNIEGE